MKSQKSKSHKWEAFDVINTILLLILVLSMIMPVWNTLAVSLSSNMASIQPGLKLWPKDISIEGYTTVWNKVQLWRPFMNNVIVTVVGTFFHVVLASMAGYVLIQKDMPGKRFMVSFIMLTMMVPSELIMIPLYVVNKELGLINHLSALVIYGLVSGFSILLMRNYFLAISDSIAESARIDGAGEFRIFSRMYMPLAKPGLATVTLFEFVSRWNHLTSAVLYISNSAKYTLQIALRSIIMVNDSTSSSDYVTPNVRMAGIIISLIPLIIIYPYAQKYFVEGIMLGSIKE